jgi:DNA-binding response OmpR family regulator
MLMPKPLILVVDDDPSLARLVSHNLELEDYQVITASDGATALQITRSDHPALVLLDVLMPKMDGFTVCRHIREFSDVPIIMITVKGEVDDIINGLKIGADDYVVKPFGINVLLARVKAVLHRAKSVQEKQQPSFTLGGLRIDFADNIVTVDGEEVALTPTEYKVLCLLARNPGKVITVNHLLTQVWGEGYYDDDSHLLHVAIGRLRKKIGDDYGNPRYILTRSGVGYVFKESKQDEYQSDNKPVVMQLGAEAENEFTQGRHFSLTKVQQ